MASLLESAWRELASGESTTAKPITSVKREEQPNTPGAAITSVKCEELPARSTAEQDPLKKKARLQACEALKNIGHDTDKDDTLKKHLPRLASVLASHQAAHVREEEKSCERREQGCEEEELEEEKNTSGAKKQKMPSLPSQGGSSAESSTSEDSDLKAAGIRKASAVRRELAAAKKKASAPAALLKRPASSAATMKRPARVFRRPSGEYPDVNTSDLEAQTVSEFGAESSEEEAHPSDESAAKIRTLAKRPRLGPNGEEYRCEACEQLCDPEYARKLAGCPHCGH